MLAGEEEVVRAWYHEHRPGGMAGNWRTEASHIEKRIASNETGEEPIGPLVLGAIRRARMLRGCAELSINRRLHISFTGEPSDYQNCVWCHTGVSHGC